MAAVLKIAGRDYSSYLKLYASEYDAVGNLDHIDPTFAGNAALSQGQVWIGDAVGNRHWQVPVLIKSSPLSVDNANVLVTAIQGELDTQGATVEYAPEGASNSSFFTLQRGVLRPSYSHPIYRRGYVVALLEFWTDPHASTGTTRLVASAVGSGPLQLALQGVLGDVDALGRVAMMASNAAGASQIVALYGIARGASYQGIWAPSALLRSAASVFGASGALASQYVGVAPAAGATQAFVNLVAAQLLDSAQPDRQRVFAIVNHRLSAGTAVALRLRDTYRNSLGPTALATQNAANKWQLVDLGEFAMPPRGTYRPVPADTAIGVDAFVNAIGGSVVASPAVRIAGLVCAPLDISAAVAVMPKPYGGVVFDGPADQNVQVIDLVASVCQSDLDGAGVVRGNPPRVPATGTPIASGAQFVGLVGVVDDYRAQDPLQVQVSVRERFSFFR